MNLFTIYYQRPGNYTRMFTCDGTLTLADLPRTHARVTSVNANSMDEVFRKMQGECWSPKGEARRLIHALGLQHTSMSIGDVLCDETTGAYYQVDYSGFMLLAYGVEEGAPKLATRLFAAMREEVFFGLNLKLIVAEYDRTELATIERFLDHCRSSRELIKTA